MGNELIVIEQTNAVAVLSTDDGIKTLLDNVRANIDSMDGGSMKNKASRAKIRSNAFQATKAYKKLNTETIEPLIASKTAEIQPQLDVINAIKANQSVLQAGLQKIRKDVNADVDKFEAELQLVEDEKAELARIAAIDEKWDFAQMMMKEYFSLIKQGDFEVAYINQLAAENAEKERVARDLKIAEDAAKAATLAAEEKAKQEAARLKKEKQDAIDAQIEAEAEAERQRKAAIQADIDLENEREQNRIDAEAAKVESNRLADEAEQLRLEQEKESARLAKEAEQRRIKDKADADALAEKTRLAAIEQTKIDEAKKITDKKLADDQAAATRKANTDHVTKIKTAIKLSLMEHAGLCEPDAINATNALFRGKVAHSSVSV